MAKNDYCVIGLGRFGSEVAHVLKENGKNVMVIDRNEDLIQKAAKTYEIAINCDASDINSLAETGVINVRTTIVAISSIEESLMVCANLRELGVKDIIAKASNKIHKRVLKTMGIAHVVIPEIEIADKIAMQALYNIGADIVSFGSGFSWIKLTVSNKDIVGKKLADLDIRKKYEATVILVQHQGEMIFPPTSETTFNIGDVVTIMCRVEKLKAIVKLFNRDSE